MVQGLSNSRVKVVLPNTLGYERVAMACSESFAKMHGLPPDRIEDLKTIVAEAATNAMKHGNGGRPDAHVTIWLKMTEEFLEVKVADEGTGFTGTFKDPDIERIMAQKEEPVGFGLFLIRKLADRVEFHLGHDGGHDVAMLINIRS